MPGFSATAAPPPFRVVQPNERITDDFFNDVKLKSPDGTWMEGRGTMLVPASQTTAMVVNTGTRTYSYRFDEAMRDNFVAARAMRRDAFLRGLMEERILPTINRRWQLEVDNERDPNQRNVRDALTSIVQQIPDFDAFKRAQLDGVWFGRAACQWAFARNSEVGNLWGIDRWDPIHGDSVQFTFEGTPAILLNSSIVGWYAANGATTGQFGDLRPTDRGGTALVLQRPYWRDRFAVHVHMREKADFFEGELAGSVQGLGLRGLIYWHYVIRQDALSWMLAYMQAVGQMDLLVFNFPAGNYAAQQQQIANANKIIGKAAIVCPRNPQGNWAAVEQISMNEAGLRALQQLVADYFDRHIERIIVGQSMSSGADKGDGLGGTGRAEFAKATKDEILIYDTGRLDDTLTRDLIAPLKKYNFPWAKFPVRFKSTMPDLDKQAKVSAGGMLIQAGVAIKVDEWREAAGFTKPEPGDEVIGGPPPMQPGMAAPGGPPQGPPQQGPPPMAAAAGGAPVRSSAAAAAWGPHGGPNKVFGYNPNPIRNSEGGSPPAAGPVMGHPGGGNTYIPRFRDKRGYVDFTRYIATPPQDAHGVPMLPPARA